MLFVPPRASVSEIIFCAQGAFWGVSHIIGGRQSKYVQAGTDRVVADGRIKLVRRKLMRVSLPVKLPREHYR